MRTFHILPHRLLRPLGKAEGAVAVIEDGDGDDIFLVGVGDGFVRALLFPDEVGVGGRVVFVQAHIVLVKMERVKDDVALRVVGGFTQLFAQAVLGGVVAV